MSDTSDTQGTDVTSASSPAPETPAPASTDQSPQATPSSAADSTAPSSGDTSRSDREGLLAAVRSVVEPKPKGDAEDAGDAGDTPVPKPETSSQQAQPPPGTPAAAEGADPSEQELRRYKPETRKRIEALLAQRDEARQRYTTVEPELAAHRQLQGYLREHQLTADDANMLLGVGAALRRGDYQAFLDGVTPYVQAAQEAIGLRLPRDLQTQVNEGTISEDAARELTRARHQAMRAEANARESQQQLQAQGVEQRVLAVRQTIDAWEADIRRRDPDYPAKADAVRRVGQALLQERGVPETPEQARVLVQMAYDEATQMLLKARPAPQATRRTPAGIQGTTQSAHAPRSMKEAALQALEAMRAGA